jgi:hypothetical protein
MADWNTVRYDPSYEEQLDPEMIPLCDALNAAGFVTVSSCVGHGHTMGPYVQFEHSTDERIERLARFVKATEHYDYRPYFTMWEKEILEEGYSWVVSIRLNEVYRGTPVSVVVQKEIDALACVTQAVLNFIGDGT